MLEGKNVDRRRTECIGFSWPPERWHHWHPPVRMGSLLMPKWGAGNPKHFMAPSGRNTNGGEEESNLFDSRLPEFSSSPCGDCYPPQNLPGGWLLCHYRSQNLGSQNWKGPRNIQPLSRAWIISRGDPYCLITSRSRKLASHQRHSFHCCVAHSASSSFSCSKLLSSDRIFIFHLWNLRMSVRCKIGCLMVIVRRTVYQCRFYKCPWKWNQNLPGNAVPCEVGVMLAMASLWE